MEEKQKISVTQRGEISFVNNPLIDICSLESTADSLWCLLGIKIKQGRYDCYDALSEDGKRIGAIMLVHVGYPNKENPTAEEREELVTPEKVGDFCVGMSGVVGFFRHPKTQYSKKALDGYLDDLKRFHNPAVPWSEVNSRQFIAPSGQLPGSVVTVWAHRSEDDGEYDALKLEFGRKDDPRNPVDAANILDAEEVKNA